MRNQVTMVGRVGKDAYITTLENGSMIARFPMAVNSSKSDNGKAVFYPLFAWGNTAEFISAYCKKGSKLAITGRLVNRTIIGQNGTPERRTEVEVRQVILL